MKEIYSLIEEGWQIISATHNEISLTKNGSWKLFTKHA